MRQHPALLAFLLWGLVFTLVGSLEDPWAHLYIFGTATVVLWVLVVILKWQDWEQARWPVTIGGTLLVAFMIWEAWPP